METKEIILSELSQMERGLDTAGAPEAMTFEDWQSQFKHGKITVAECVYEIVMKFNHTNGNQDIAMRFLQALTGEDKPLESYAYYLVDNRTIPVHWQV